MWFCSFIKILSLTTEPSEIQDLNSTYSYMDQISRYMGHIIGIIRENFISRIFKY